LPPPHGILAILFVALSCLFVAPMKAQTIQIDSTFTSDGEIFPFDTIQALSELLADGEVSLSSDTSLVRILFVDEDDIHYLVFEAYPLICESLDFSFTQHCDETCYLDQVHPYSLIIQVIDAELELKDLYYDTDPKQDPENQRYEAKRDKDFEKIETLNHNIPAYGMNWTAGDNSVVEKYYDQKRFLFGEVYNLLGYDYYYNGVFEFLGRQDYPKVDPDIVWEFDWRNRHGIDDPSSGYWDGNEDKAGWLTGAKDQNSCGSCWAFASVGVTEALVNLFTARNLDYDLSEQDLLCNDTCAYADGCDGSKYTFAGLLYIKNTGIVTEACFPYDTISYADSCDYISPCSTPDPIIKIFDTLHLNMAEEKDFDTIRKELINRGPLKISYPRPTGNHAVALAGFKFNVEDSTLTFIIKDSQGNEGPNMGFKELKLEYINHAYAVIPPIYRNDTVLVDSCYDFDNDGYCFWGIGREKPEDCNCQFEDEDCDDSNPYVGGYDSNYYCSCIIEMDTATHIISADTTWADSTLVNFNVSIDSGVCLTISSYVAFAPGARIVVTSGARLLIDGGYLTRACNELWEGIEVWGNDTIQNFDQYFGKITLTNGAVIEFAQIGIANYCKRCASITMQSGGIIMAEDATFRNNEIDVQFSPFRNILMGKELSYMAVFSKCTFTTTEDLYPFSDPITHIDMNDVYGVKFDGCTFKNELGLRAIPNSNRGRGITSIDANFMLREYCNTPNIIPCNDVTPCEFIALEYGIKAINSYSLRTLDIRNVYFEDNLVGISLSGIDYASILENNFKCPIYITGVSSDRYKGGLFLENCTGYHIEGNDFASSTGMEGKITPAYGIGIKNSGPDDNEIYRNKFNKLETGIVCIGENRGRESGLCLKCNQMSLDTNDFIVYEDINPPSGSLQGINLFQGNPDDTISSTAPAGNTFTFFPIPADANEIENYNYLNAAEDIYYIHHAENQYYLVIPLDTNYTKETIELIGTQIGFDTANSCPSTIGGNNLKSGYSPNSTIIEADYNIAFLTNQLNLLIDGGNTYELNFEVMTSMPDEGLEIRQQLLNESPYLSDTVIKQAIYKEDVLPNAMVRDILGANPQSAKSDDILNTLNYRFNPMPDYMMSDIMEGKRNFGAKEILDAKIRAWKQIRTKAKAELMRQFLMDTNVVNPIDSVIYFLETENDLKSNYNLAVAYWNKSDTNNARIVLNNIPMQFSLTADQSIIHQQYLTYFNILGLMIDSIWQPSQIDSASIITLFELLTNGNANIAARSRGLLAKGGFMDYVETIGSPNFSKSSPSYYYQMHKGDDQHFPEHLRLFPNPAGDYVIAYYQMDERYRSGLITINDMHGKFIKNYSINAGENQRVLDLKDVPIGIYIVRLLVGYKEVIGEIKLIKARY